MKHLLFGVRIKIVKNYRKLLTIFIFCPVGKIAEKQSVGVYF